MAGASRLFLKTLKDSLRPVGIPLPGDKDISDVTKPKREKDFKALSELSLASQSDGEALRRSNSLEWLP